jgi:hypothetical protein
MTSEAFALTNPPELNRDGIRRRDANSGWIRADRDGMNGRRAIVHWRADELGASRAARAQAVLPSCDLLYSIALQSTASGHQPPGTLLVQGKVANRYGQFTVNLRSITVAPVTSSRDSTISPLSANGSPLAPTSHCPNQTGWGGSGAIAPWRRQPAGIAETGLEGD